MASVRAEQFIQQPAVIYFLGFNTERGKNIKIRAGLRQTCSASRAEARQLVRRHRIITLSPELPDNNLSFSNIVEIMMVQEKIGRYIYEIECIICRWSVK